MDHDGLVIGRDAIAERSDETDQSCWRVRNSEIRPCVEMKVANNPTWFTLNFPTNKILGLLLKKFVGNTVAYPTHAEFRNGPISIVAFVEDCNLKKNAYLNEIQDPEIWECYLNVSVINGLSVKWPIAIALFTTLFYTTGEHNNCTGARFPSHAPEIVASWM